MLHAHTHACTHICTHASRAHTLEGLAGPWGWLWTPAARFPPASAAARAPLRAPGEGGRRWSGGPRAPPRCLPGVVVSLLLDARFRAGRARASGSGLCAGLQKVWPSCSAWWTPTPPGGWRSCPEPSSDPAVGRSWAPPLHQLLALTLSEKVCSGGRGRWAASATPRSPSAPALF